MTDRGAASRKAVEALRDLGFSEYEAKAYVALLRHGPANGYQLSKRSGIPRSRVYDTLERLAGAGYALSLSADRAEYAALPAPDLLASLKGRMDQTLGRLSTEISRLPSAAQPESIWNLRGREAILDRARAMTAGASQSVYLAAWAQTFREIEAELEAAVSRGVRVVMVSCGPVERSFGVHYRHAFEEHIVCADDSSIDLVVDGREVLVGQTAPADDCRAGWSRNTALVGITTEYIRHEVYLHKIIARLGDTAGEELRGAMAEGLGEVPYAEGGRSNDSRGGETVRH